MIIILRIIFIIMTSLFSFLYCIDISLKAAIITASISAAIALVLIVLIEYIMHTFSSRILFSAILGILIGLLLAHLTAMAFTGMSLPVEGMQLTYIKAAIYHLISFTVMMFFVINNEDIPLLNKIFPEKVVQSTEGGISYKIVDTSAIIDGRIADICSTGFIEGILVIPSFVVNELQMVADSKDSIKRNRGRRGLDILNKMQKDQDIMVKISQKDFPDIAEVDDKLVRLGSLMNAKLITNDFNLNKVAELHGVPVLNINQLSNALKPIVLPGEKMKVVLVKEGKDQSQAIGYLDDGTMVVVEDGRRKLNKEVDVTVTSVLQTTAGRMIFAKIKT